MKKAVTVSFSLFVVCLMFLVLRASAQQQVPCPPMPDLSKVSRDIHSDIQASVGSLGKLNAGQLRVQTDVIAKSVFEKYPNIDRVVMVQMMAATYCPLILGDYQKSPEKLRLWSTFIDRVFRYENPEYKPVPSVTPRSTVARQAPSQQGFSDLLAKIHGFNEAQPSTPYGWDKFVGDANTLYRYAMDFYDLLKSSHPRYDSVSAVYAALDEAADELSMRGKLMHDSGMVSNDTDQYDRHIFVGPGWFRLNLEELRKAHEEHKTPSDDQINAFGLDVDYWRICRSGTSQNSSTCK